MSFEKLLAELQELQSDQEDLQKALPDDSGEDDEKIRAAAEDGRTHDPDVEPDSDRGEREDDEVDEGEVTVKSFTLKLDDGTEIEAQDGTELVKALTARLDKTEASMKGALETAVSLIKKQGDMIKSLSERVAKLGGEGRGRKAVVSVVERPNPGSTLSKSDPASTTGEEFLAKALDAQKAGRITSLDVATAEACLNRGQPVPASIIQRVVQ